MLYRWEKLACFPKLWSTITVLSSLWCATGSLLVLLMGTASPIDMGRDIQDQLETESLGEHCLLYELQ